MKQTFKFFVDTWVTSLVGIIIYSITTYLIIKGRFDFLWEGVGGYGTGTILLLAPKSVETLISKWIENKKDGSS